MISRHMILICMGISLCPWAPRLRVLAFQAPVKFQGSLTGERGVCVNSIGDLDLILPLSCITCVRLP